ncbi:hypothetical protein P171DRAFT_438971 [Karstenula rhodostoma CBS 690.94]|uniref:Uncharacterized protein n=1 Tax=Karstenula rhodostoma CBS 690.94 TaxID=1392251 RepID=A0A9P4PU76_9PLEO|nr:hypothetical protein P171DRAFT_438971 [Karstenula rhodostoma CBS 690.94]
MDQPNPGVSLTSLAKPRLSMADAMRAALQSSLPPPESTHEREMRASYDAINALLDHGAVAEGHPIGSLPYLLRLFQGQNNVGPFSAMVEFACTPRQRLVNWRNCTAHKNRLATMDLTDPQGAFKQMEAEVRGMPIRGEDNTSTMAGSAVPTGSGPQELWQTAGDTLLHLSFSHDRPATPQSPATLLSPYSTPIQQPTKLANESSSSPTQPWMRDGSSYAENASVKSVAKPPTSSSSPFLPGSAQEHLQESRAHMMEGHMPRLSTRMYRSPYNGATHRRPYVNSDMAAHARHGCGQVQSLESANVRSNPYNATVTVTSNPGVTQQQQTPYAHLESMHRAGNNQFVPSQPAHAAFGNDSNSCPTYRPGTQAQPVMSPYAEFQAKVNGQQPQKLHMPETVNTQQLAKIYIEIPHNMQPGQNDLLTPSGYQPAASNQRRLYSELGYSIPSHASVNHPDSYAASAAPSAQARTKTKEELEYEQKPSARQKHQARIKTKEELEYEQKLATWQKHQAEKEKQERIEENRKKELKAELTAAIKEDPDLLTYRYREWIEVNQLGEGERLNTYYLSFLANQVVDEKEKTEGAMAVRYAKEKYWNQWKKEDKLTVIKLLRDKAQKQNHGMFEEMKTGGYLITAADIQAIRQTAPLYAVPEAE